MLRIPKQEDNTIQSLFCAVGVLGQRRFTDSTLDDFWGALPVTEQDFKVSSAMALTFASLSCLRTGFGAWTRPVLCAGWG